MALAAHSQQLEDRIGRMEERITSTNDRVDQMPSQSDMINVKNSLDSSYDRTRGTRNGVAI